MSAASGRPDTGSRAALLATKVHPPLPRPRLVPRDRLVQRLAAGTGRLTVLTAPAGWGKTTLALEWRRCDPARRAFAWVSLDRDDADPVRFWTCVVEALGAATPGRADEAARLLLAPRADIRGSVVPALVNAFADDPEPRVVLVLDDFQAVRSDEVDEQLTYLVAHLPQALHVAVLSRTRPRLPVARLRAQGALTEIDAADLRFSPAETQALLVDVLGLKLAADDVREVQRRTEGWVAALHLAALSLVLRGGDHAASIRRFTGRDQHLVDYLGAEVLHGLDPDLRDFLVRTSTLARLCPPLCDAVTGRTDSAEMLRAVEGRNLLVVPLDDERRWLRYHHLFADMLRLELAGLPADEVATLHGRAALWHMHEGSPSEALRHALLAGDGQLARGIVDTHWNDYYNRGRLATVSGWLDALGDDVVRDDAWLSAARVLVWADEGRLDELDAWLEIDGERLVDGYPYAIMRALHRFKSGDLVRAADELAVARGLRALTHPFWPTVEHCVAGVVAYWAGDPELARAELATAHALASSYGNVAGRTYALGYLALVAIDEGDLPLAARRLGEVAPQLRAGSDLESHFVTALPQLATGLHAAADGGGAPATPPLRRAVAVARTGAGRLELVATLAALGRSLAQDGDRTGALAALTEASALLLRCPAPGRARALVADQPGIRRVTSSREDVTLTARESAVLRLLASGLSLREVADELFVSHNTVKSHSRSLYRKLAASTRDEAVRTARASGLL